MGRIGFLPRFGAWILDMIFILCLYYAFAKLMLTITNVQNDPYGKYVVGVINYHLTKTGSWLATLIGISYYALEILIGATLGKLVLGLRIGAQNGKKASLCRLFVRVLLKHADFTFALTVLLITGSIGLFSYYPGEAMSAGFPKGAVQAINTFAILVGIYKLLDILCIFVADDLTLHDILSGTAVFFGTLYSEKEAKQMAENKRNLEQERIRNNQSVNTLLFK